MLISTYTQVVKANLVPTATNTDAHQHTPENDDADDREGWSIRGERLSESGEDDQDELQTVHLLAADHVCKPSEAKLADDCAS